MNNIAWTLDGMGTPSAIKITPLGGFSYAYFDSVHPTNRVGSIT